MTRSVMDRRDDWHDAAACLDHDPRLWDSTIDGENSYGDARRTRLDRAIGICLECPVADQCEAEATPTDRQYTVRAASYPRSTR